MNVFQEDWSKGTKFEDHFNNLVRKAYPLLGELRRITIYGLDSSGHAFYASNRPDIAEEALHKKYFLYQANWQYLHDFKPRLQTFSTQFGHENSKVYRNRFKCTAVYIREQLNKKLQLITMFSSTNPLIILDALANNPIAVKKLLQFFKKESEHVIRYHKKHRFNIASVRPGYFAKEQKKHKTDRDKANYLLHTLGILYRDESLTEREFQCLELYRLGKSARETGEILGISNRTVETHFNNLKCKLKINLKSELIEYLN